MYARWHHFAASDCLILTVLVLTVLYEKPKPFRLIAKGNDGLRVVLRGAPFSPSRALPSSSARQNLELGGLYPDIVAAVSM